MNSPFRMACLLAALALAGGCVGTSLDNTEEGRMAQKARSAFDDDRYSEAADAYMEAIALCETNNPDKAKYFRGKLSEVYREWAMNFAYARKDRTVEDYEQAVKLCENAKEVYPDARRRCDEMIEEFQKKIKILKYRAEISEEKLIPDGKKRNEKIDIFLKQGKALAAAKRYSDARDKFEEVLRLDPYSMEATQEIKKLNVKLAQAAKERAAASRGERIAEVEWKYVPPLPPKENLGEQPSEEPSPVEKAMRDTIIPSLDFKELKLKEAFAKLEAESANGGSQPVKFVFDGIDPVSDEWPLLVFKAERIPLGEAVNSICKTVGLLYAPAGPGQVKIFRKP